ncbi:hypothetical protein SRHO_G00080490 [Serrasalmus rhombeus]
MEDGAGMATRLKGKKSTQQPEKRDYEADSGDSVPVANAKTQDGGRAEETVKGGKLELILREIRDFRQDSKSQLEAIKGEISNINSRMDAAETQIIQNEERIQVTENVLAEMLKLQTQLQGKLMDQESRSRRENVRIYGVPEGAEGEADSVTTFVEKLLRENLDIPPSTDMLTERAHRALGPRPPAGAPLRSLVVRFLSYRTKESILKLAWQKRGFVWKDNKISLDHDYASGILNKRREYAEARRIRTLYPAKLKVFYDDGTVTYESVEEATRDMADRDLPVTVIMQPDTLLDQIRRLTWQPGGPRSRQGGRYGDVAGFKEKLSVFKRNGIRAQGLAAGELRLLLCIELLKEQRGNRERRTTSSSERLNPEEPDSDNRVIKH